MTSSQPLFVYGTLVPGGRAHSLVADYITSAEPAFVAGTLFDTGAGYPAALFSLDAPGRVHGWRFELVERTDLPSLDVLWARLDRFEGEEYRRVLVRTPGGAPAVAYGWIASTAGFRRIEDGRWPAS